MGRRGPAKTPTALQVARGNPGHRPINRAEPKPPPGLPECPPELGPVAQAEWARILPDLAAMGLAARVDRAALAAYCQAWARWLEAEGQLRQYGVVIKSPSGYPILSPYFSVANTAAAQMKGFLQEFGMTPGARARLKTPEGEAPDDGDELAAFRKAHPRRQRSA